MKTLNANQILGQQQSSRDAYFSLIFTSKDGLTTYDFSTDSAVYPDRILLIDHTEEPYNDYAYIMLRNDNRDIPDLKGYWVEIGYGDYYSGTAYHSHVGRLWVKEQRIISAPGRLYTLLVLTGVWELFKEQPGLAGTALSGYTDAGATVWNGMAIFWIISEIAQGVEDVTGYVTVTQYEGTDFDQGMFYYYPGAEIDIIPWANASELIQKLLSWTKCFIRIREGFTLDVVYPKDTDVAVKTFYNNQVPKFIEYTDSDNVLVPNRIIVYYNQISDNPETWPDPIPMAESLDTASIAAYMEVPKHFKVGIISSSSDAQIRADAILMKSKYQMVQGQLIMPHDASLELYDLIAISDTRGS